MDKVKIFCDKNMIVGNVAPELFGSFVEHLGRCVYTGIYEPEHPQADKDGFRNDVAEMVKELDVPIVRYPGGNFVSGYDWRDGIGPVDERPARLDLAWKTTESNKFGTDEFMLWCKKTGIKPMMAVNLGTGTPLDAAQLVEYCNHKGGSYYSELRKKNTGNDEAYNVNVWCLGNEMDGPWQTCHMSAEDYSKKALVTAKMMRQVDSTIKLVACGSSGAEMPSYPEWDRIVLDNLYDVADYISMHRYYWYTENLNDFFASYKDMDDFIKTIKAACNYVQAKHRSKKEMMISFDEWNVWYQNAQGEANWAEAPNILEDKYSLKDALAFSGMMNTLLNNCDRVKIACLAQLVNVIAPIFTEKGGKAIKQSIFYPFELGSRYGRGIVLNSITQCSKFESMYGMVDYVSSSVVYDENEKTISVFLTNYNNESMECELELRSFGALKATDCVILDGDDLEAYNTFDNPDNVITRKGELPQINDGIVISVLPAYSYVMLRLSY